MTKKTEKKITIPPIMIATMTVTIEGLSPLICNRFSDRAATAIRDKQQGKARGPRKPKDPEAEYEGSLYPKRNGHYTFPASGIKKAMVDACPFAGGITMTRARGAFYVQGDFVPIEGEPKMREDITKLQGRIADLRYRGEFTEWSITFDILYCPDVITEESIINLIDRAGFHIGIGDWRPQKKGDKGMFRVSSGQ